MEFIRFGGLSKVKYNIKNSSFSDYHTPPVKKGIFAFIYPYIEPFLYYWKYSKYVEDESTMKSRIRKERKKFTYNGMLWCHMTDIVHYGRTKGSWVEVHTDDLESILRKQMHIDSKSLLKDLHKFDKSRPKSIIIANPYKVGLNGLISRDHLEVFIEKVN